jgi:ecotin
VLQTIKRSDLGKGGCMKKVILIVFASMLTISLPGFSADNMKAFPPAEDGMVRHVLQLPHQDNESNFKLELIVGKTVLTDPDNRYFFAGNIERKTIPGWGFSRYIVSELGPMAGTLMAVDPSKPKVERFITLGGEPYLIRYNSHLPVVVYVAEGVEVRYRVWCAGIEHKF